MPTKPKTSKTRTASKTTPVAKAAKATVPAKRKAAARKTASSKDPLVSIVMPVYNAQEFLNIAIDSILNQTYKHFELILIDDGSTDNSASIIRNYDDKRIKYHHQKNQGLVKTLIKGFGLAEGEFVARMDADDISYPERLERQVAYLKKHPKTALLGTCYDLIDLDGRIIDRSYHLTEPDDIYGEFLVRNPFGHGTAMMRRTYYEAVGGYDPDEPIEDYELWWRIAKNYPVANLPEFLYGWRVNPTGISHSTSIKRQAQITALMERIWQEHDSLSPPREHKAALARYRAFGPKYEEQYRYYLAALCLAFKATGQRLSYAQLFTTLATSRTSRKVLSDDKAHPTSHNYNWKLLKKT
jgi:glycosyltransferase involved in cell wall biosynthesis